MTNTLEALDRSVVERPADRTVRLVYADALDEAGGPAAAARSEFVRTQVALEAIPADDPRSIVSASRCRELFEADWLDWWRPACAAAGLPAPHVPGKRRPPAAGSARRPRRTRNWPYTHTAADTTVHAAPYGLSFKFAAGFPEEVRVLNLDTPEGGPDLIHRWGDAMPVVRLAFAPHLSPAEWERVAGPHLARLPELVFERLSAETAVAVAACPHLTAVTRLTARPTGVSPETARVLVANPPWAGLRALTLGRMPPVAVQTLTRACVLEELEELDLTLGDPGEFGTPIGEMLNAVIQMLIRAVAQNVPPVRWAEYGPAVEALAAAPWARRLRRLAVRTDGPRGLLALLGRPLTSPADGEANVLPDGAVLALADALAGDKLEALTLSAAVVGPAARDGLTKRLGRRLVLV